jgi:hypothetical protein
VARMPSKFDLEAVVQHHDSQLEAFGNRMGVVEKTLTAHSSVLQEIKDAVVKQGARPSFDPRNTIGITKDVGIVFAMVCAGILYLANVNATATVAAGSKELTVLQERERVVQERLKAVESLVLPQSWQVTRK